MAIRSAQIRTALTHNTSPRVYHFSQYRAYSNKTSHIITAEFKKKYDHFIHLPSEKKLERLIAQGLHALTPLLKKPVKLLLKLSGQG